MIRILRHGHKMEIECQHCGALLSYEYEDIQEKSYNAHSPLGGWKRYIICPQCNKEVVTEASK